MRSFTLSAQLATLASVSPGFNIRAIFCAVRGLMRSEAILPTVWWPSSPQASAETAGARKMTAVSSRESVLFHVYALSLRIRCAMKSQDP